MKSLRIAFVTVVVLTLVSPATAADFGIRAGRYNDAEEEFVGAEMVFDIGAININPNIEYSLADNVTAGTANIDVLLEIAPASRIAPYLGAGVGMYYVDADLGDNRSDLVGNLIGGLSFNLDFLKPYAQVKYFRLLEDDDGEGGDDIALTVGLRF